MYQGIMHIYGLVFLLALLCISRQLVLSGMSVYFQQKAFSQMRWQNHWQSQVFLPIPLLPRLYLSRFLLWRGTHLWFLHLRGTQVLASRSAISLSSRESIRLMLPAIVNLKCELSFSKTVQPIPLHDIFSFLKNVKLCLFFCLNPDGYKTPAGKMQLIM